MYVEWSLRLQSISNMFFPCIQPTYSLQYGHMNSTKNSFSFKKSIPHIAVLIIVAVALILFFTLRAPKVEPLSDQQKQDFLNYINQQKPDPFTKKEKKSFLKEAEEQQPMTQQQKDDFAKSIR